MHWQVHVCAWRYSLLPLALEAIAIVGTVGPRQQASFFRNDCYNLSLYRHLGVRKEILRRTHRSRRCTATSDESVAACLPRQYRYEEKVPNSRQRAERTRKSEVVNNFARR